MTFLNFSLRATRREHEQKPFDLEINSFKNRKIHRLHMYSLYFLRDFSKSVYSLNSFIFIEAFYHKLLFSLLIINKNA